MQILTLNFIESKQEILADTIGLKVGSKGLQTFLQAFSYLAGNPVSREVMWRIEPSVCR